MFESKFIFHHFIVSQKIISKYPVMLTIREFFLIIINYLIIYICFFEFNFFKNTPFDHAIDFYKILIVIIRKNLFGFLSFPLT